MSEDCVTERPLCLGFLTALEDAQGGFLGGYLVTNQRGRPLEFQCTTVVRPNRSQRILYGSTLRPYLMGELIGLTLVEKASTKADLLFTDQPPVLALRRHLDTPLVCLDQPGEEGAAAAIPPEPGSPEAFRQESPLTATLCCELGFDADRTTIEAWLRSLETPLDLYEPFCRIREAVDEAQPSSALR